MKLIIRLHWIACGALFWTTFILSIMGYRDHARICTVAFVALVFLLSVQKMSSDMESAYNKWECDYDKEDES